MAKIKFDFNPFKTTGIQFRGAKRKSALTEVRSFLNTAIRTDISSEKSPVSGRDWRGLSRDYAKIKGRNVADLKLTGSMLNNFKVKKKDASNVRLEVTGKKNQLKADNHNHHGKFGDATLPKRQFIPNENIDSQVARPFRAQIMGEVRKILKKHGT